MPSDEALFERLYGDEESGWIGMFFLNREAGSRQMQQFPVKNWREALQYASSVAGEGVDCYFSPALLKEQLEDNRRGKKEDYLGSRCLWVDLDAKDGRTQEEARLSLLGFKLRPSIIVSSGHGTHAYWILDHLETDQDKIEHRNNWLAEQLGADPCHSIDHLLRVPGTQNWK